MGKVVVYNPVFPEIPVQEFFGAFTEVFSGMNAEAVHFMGGYFADAPESFYRKSGNKFRGFVGVNDVKTVRLAIVGSDFSQKFIVGNSGRSNESQFFPDVFLYGFGNVRRQFHPHFVFSDVQESFVQGQGFDKIGVPVEYLPDFPGNGFVYFYAGRNKDQLGTQLHRFLG